jgi:hypothetical protein
MARRGTRSGSDLTTVAGDFTGFGSPGANVDNHVGFP